MRHERAEQYDVPGKSVHPAAEDRGDALDAWAAISKGPTSCGSYETIAR
jgi:hypothetical protein